MPTMEMADQARPAGVTIVAGGSGALGAEICRTLARQGANIAFTYRTNQQAAMALEEQLLAMGCEVHAAQVTLEDDAQTKTFVDTVAEQFGGINAVVYAAGPHLEFTFISAISPADWRRVMDSDVNGCFNILAAALPHLRKAGNGAIVAVTTAATEKVPVQDILSAAPKVAIEMLVKGIAKEEGRYGIRGNCVGPGFTNVGIGGQILAQDAAITAMLKKSLPLKRFGTAADIAEAVAFLLSDKANYITGQSLAVDGGLQL